MESKKNWQLASSFCVFFFQLIVFNQTALANQTPDCSGAFAGPASLWPPNHSMQSISINGVIDGDGEIPLINIQCIYQDESLDSNGDGNTEPDADGINTGIAQVRSERQGGGNGRVYHVFFKASDSIGAACFGEVTVDVNQSKKKTAIDDGSLFESVPSNLPCEASPNTAPHVNDLSSSTIEDTVVDIILSGSDPNNDPLIFSIATNPKNGSVSLSGDTVTYTPGDNFNGIDSFTYQANDGELNSNIGTVTVTVNAQNDAPSANPQSVSTQEDTVLPMVLTGTDIENSSLVFMLQTQPQNGIISGTLPNISFTPNANFSGTDSFTFIVNDGELNSSPATIDITITPVNDAPVADSQSVSIAEDMVLPIALTGSDIENSSLVFTLQTQPQNGIISGALPNISFTPNADFSGTDSFTFIVNDGELNSSPATIDITIIPVNDVPVADSQSAYIAEDMVLPIVLTGTDIESSTLTFTLQIQPLNGTISGALPNISFTPNANFSGADSFSFIVNDGELNSTPATIDITVTPVNDAPIADSQSVSVAEDMVLPIVLTGTDIENSTLTFTLQTQPLNGTISGTLPNISFAPNTNFSGADSFTFIVNDGELNSSPATIDITITPVNDVPVADSQSVSVAEDAVLNITLSGSDVENSSLVFQIHSQPQNGTLTGTAPDIVFTPNENFNGSDAFTFIVNDGDLHSTAATVNIIVTAVNDAPNANNQLATVLEDDSIAITLSGEDVDGDSISFQISTQPQFGVLTGMAPDLLYTPNADFSGDDTFTFETTDGVLTSPPATVSLSVTAVNDAPVADTQTVNTDEDVAVAIVLSGSDIENDPLTFTVIDQPLNGALSGSPPNLTYTPNNHFFGQDTFTFHANDGLLDSTPATVTITIAEVNVAPTITSAAITEATVGENYSYTVVADDPDGDSLLFSLITVVTGMSIDPQTGVINWIPGSDQVGDQSVTVGATDPGNLFAEQSFIVTVIIDNQPPAINSTPLIQSVENTGYQYTVTATDPNLNDTLTFSLLSSPPGMTINDTNGLVQWVPDSAFAQSLLNQNVRCEIPAQQTETQFSDVITLMDESGSMEGEHAWSSDFIPILEAQLQLRDVGISTVNQYGLVGYGQDIPDPRTIPVGGGDFGSYEDYIASSTQLIAQGKYEDGYWAIEYALQNYALREGSNRSFILVSDEDRDNLNNMTIAQMTNLLLANNVILHAVVDIDLECGDGTKAMGITADGIGYVDDGFGHYYFCDNAIAKRTNENPMVLDDYVALAFATQGSAWDIGRLREGGAVAASFSAAMADEEAQAVVEAIPAIPLADITISNLQLSLINQADNPPANLTAQVDISNRGLSDLATDAQLQLFNGDTNGELLGVVALSSLAANTTQTVDVSFTTPAQWQSHLSAHAQLLNDSEDCLTANNMAVFPVLEIQVTDAAGLSDQQMAVLNVSNVNETPVITSSPVVNGFTTQTYRYQVLVNEPDLGDVVQFGLTQSPTGMLIDPISGLISFDPKDIHLGDQAVSVTVEDLAGNSAVQTYTLNIADPAPDTYTDPVIEVKVKIGIVENGTHFTYIPAVEKHPAAQLSFEFFAAPAGMTIDPLTGQVNWDIPVDFDTQGYVIALIFMRDQFDNLSIQILWLVAHEFPPMPAQTVIAGHPLSFIRTDASSIFNPVEYRIVSGPESAILTRIDSSEVNWTPANNEVGLHTIVLGAVDQKGALSTQAVPITVTENHPPVITSTAPGAAITGHTYTYKPVATDEDGDNTYTRTLVSGPPAMYVSATGTFVWKTTAADVGVHSVTARVHDGYGLYADQTFEITVVPNTPPVFISVPGDTAFVGIRYIYEQTATDADGDGVTIRIVSGPDNIGYTGRGFVTFVPRADQLGEQTIVLEADDAFGGVTTQEFIVNVMLNQPPQFTTEALILVVADQPYRYKPEATDPETGTPVSPVLISGPAAMTQSLLGILVWNPTVDDVGTHPVVVEASDAQGNVGSQTFTITVITDTFQILDGPFNEFVFIDELFTSTVTAYHPQNRPLTFTVLSPPAGLSIDPLTGVISWTANSSQIGSHSITVEVADDLDVVVSQDFTLKVVDPNDAINPFVEITSPTDKQKVTAPIDVVGTVTDPALVSYTVYLTDPKGNIIKTIGSGTESVTNGVLAVLDPTLLRNGLYQVAVIAEDLNGNQSQFGVKVKVTGNLKVGHFSFTVEDLNIPLAGIPIRVTRTYDTRRKHEDLDFGFGWSIDYQNVDVDESRKAGLGWEFVERTTGPGGTLIEYCMEPQGAPLVTITLPNDEVETFEVAVTPHCNLVQSITEVHLVFNAVDDTQSTLELPNGGLQVSLDTGTDSLILLGPNEVYDPDNYQLTTKAGYVYHLNQNFGIEKVVDPNGHTLTYSDTGIVHSSGKTITFQRNVEGRIERIVDPSNNELVYLYDAVDDLVTVRDQVLAETDYTYNNEHAMLEILDPLNRPLIKNIYDEVSGRLIAQEDNNGKRKEFNHNLDGRLSIVTDRRNNTTQFFYDERGNVLNQVDALNGISSFTYDSDDNQLTQTNPLTQTSSATYNDRHDQLTQSDALNNTIEFTYNNRGQELTVKDARNNTFTNVYDTVGNLVSITDPENNSAGNQINAEGLVDFTQDVLGNRTSFTYDEFGNKLTETDPLLNATTFTYDDNGNVLTESRSRTLPDNSVVTEITTFEYDDRNRVIRTIDPLNNETSTVYDLMGNRIEEKDAFNRITSFEYDIYNRLTKTTYPDTTTETKTYDDEGNLISETDRLNRTTTFTYDALNRLSRTTYADTTFTETVYDAAGRVIEEIDENQNSTTFVYDDAGRRTKTINALSQEHSFEYDVDGNLTKEIDALNHETVYDYNTLDQRVKTTFHNGSFMQEGFDALERRISQTDQAGVTTNYEYDALGRLIKVTDVLLNETRFEYDEVGNKTAQIDAEGRRTEWQYDGLGRVTLRRLPMGQEESFTYDVVGNVITQSDFNGDITTNSYDTMNRLVLVTYQGGVIDSFVYDAVGNRTSATIDGATTAYEYDARNRLIKETQPDGSLLEYAYDNVGNKTQLTVTRGTDVRVEAFTYDGLNRLSTVTDRDNHVTTYDYDAVGNRSSVTHPNGNVTTYTYDDLNRLTKLETRDLLNAVVASYDYVLHATGRRMKITELSGRVSDYVYDSLYRLVQETITDSVNGNYSADYVLDKVGNRTYSTIDGVQTQYTYNDNDWLLQQGGVHYGYDAAGNTKTQTEGANTVSYEYDKRHRLVRTIQADLSESSYSYNADGIRIGKIENAVTTQYLIDTNQAYAQVIAEIDNGQLVVEYVYGDDLVSQNRNSGLAVYQYDGLGSTRSLTDSSGVVIDTYDYDTYGNLLASTGSTVNDYRFTGEQFDGGLGQYYLRARYYNQGVGRFTQMDSWRGNNYDPVTLHKYLYAHSDPVTYTDPTGKFSIGSLMTAVNIIGTLSTIVDAVQFGSGVVSGERELTAKDIGFLILESMLGKVGGKALGRLLGIGCNSFTSETLVATEFGLVAIKHIKIGDNVWAYDEITGEKSLQEVIHLIQSEGIKELIDIKLEMGDIITVTAEHPFYLADTSKWVNASALTSDDNLLGLQGFPLPIDDVDAFTRQVTVYNLTVNVDHTYFVGEAGALNHNAKKKCKKTKNDPEAIRPAGAIRADQGLDVFAKKVKGQRGLNRGELGTRFHRIKAKGDTPGADQSNSVNPITGDVFDGRGNYIGNLLDDYF